MDYGFQQRSRAAGSKQSLRTVASPVCSYPWGHALGLSGQGLLIVDCSTGGRSSSIIFSCCWKFLASLLKTNSPMQNKTFFLLICISNPKPSCQLLSIPIKHKVLLCPSCFRQAPAKMTAMGEDCSIVFFHLIEDSAMGFIHYAWEEVLRNKNPPSQQKHRF